MKQILGVAAAVCVAAALTAPAVATAAVNTATASLPTPIGTIEMQTTADCPGGDGKCFFRTQVNLLTPTGPVGLPQESWARQSITIRSTDRSVWQEAWFSAPAGMPRELKGANHNGVLSHANKSVSDYLISVTYFGGGPRERFAVDGDSVQTDWSTGRPATDAGFIVCSDIHVVIGGINVRTPAACAQTTFG